MAYGMIVKNSDDEIQIDGEYQNYTLFDSGSFNFDTTGSGMRFVNFTDTDKVPIYAFRPISSCFIGAGHWIKSGDDFTQIYTPMEKDETGTIEWVLFTEGNTNALPEYGMVIKNAGGDVVFSSDEEYFKIVSINSVSHDRYNQSTDYDDITGLDVDNNYFFLVHFVQDPYFESFSGYYAGLKRLSSSSIRVASFSAGTATGPAANFESYSGLLIEVSK